MLLFMDGQAHYSSAQIARKYSTLTDTATTWTVATDGRFGHCLKRVSASAFSGESAMLTIAPLMTRSGVWTPKTSGVAGFALKVDDLEALADSSIAYNSTLIKIAEGASYHCRVNLNPAGTFTLIQNIGSAENSSGATILAHSVGGIAGGSWAYLEFKWDLDGGSFEIRVNGSTVLDYTGTITENELLFNSLGVWNGIKILGITSQATPLLTLRMMRAGGGGVMTAAQFAFDLATGAAGAETVLIPDLRYSTGSGSYAIYSGWRHYTFPTYIASSTRIAARCSCDITAAGDRTLGIMRAIVQDSGAITWGQLDAPAVVPITDADLLDGAAFVLTGVYPVSAPARGAKGGAQ